VAGASVASACASRDNLTSAGRSTRDQEALPGAARRRDRTLPPLLGRTCMTQLNAAGWMDRPVRRHEHVRLRSARERGEWTRPGSRMREASPCATPRVRTLCDRRGRPPVGVHHRARHAEGRHDPRVDGMLPDGASFQATSGGSTLYAHDRLAVRRGAARRWWSTSPGAGRRRRSTRPARRGRRSRTTSAAHQHLQHASELTQMSFSGNAGVFGRTYRYGAGSADPAWRRGRQLLAADYDSRDRLQDYRDTRTWTETVWEPWDPYGDCPGCFIQTDVTPSTRFGRGESV
jgi:hypothetical protein